MPSPRLVLVCSIPLIAALVACQGKGMPPAASTEAKAKPASEAKPTRVAQPADTAPAPTPNGGPTPTEAAPLGAGATPVPEQGPVPALQNDPEKALGAHLVDPRWFRKTIFGDESKVLDTKRSKADDQGRFSSLIRFELSDMTLEACADHLQGVVKEDVPAVTRETKPDGRIQLSGKADRYEITFVCGQHEGKTIAFVSYQWT